MECSIESDDLRNIWKHFLACPDSQQVCRVVQRGKVAAELDLGKDILIHDGTAGEEIRTLDDPVPHGLDVIEGLEHSVILVHESIQNQLHSHLMVRDREILYYLILTCRLVLQPS